MKGFKVAAAESGWSEKADLKAADRALRKYLKDCMLDLATISESAFSDDTLLLPATAAHLVLDALGKLSASETKIFAPPGDSPASSNVARSYALAVAKSAFAAALQDREYFADIQRELVLRLARESGVTVRSVARIETGIDQLNDKLDKMVAELAGDREHAGAILKRIAISFGQLKPTASLHEIESFLREQAEKMYALQDRLRRLDSSDPTVAALRAEAADALDSADFGEADKLLSRAEKIDLDSVCELGGHAVARRLSAAETRAERGRTACLDPFAYHEAAEHYAVAANLADPASPEMAWRYAMDRAILLTEHGTEFGDIAAIIEAIDVYRKHCLTRASQKSFPIQWAETQIKLGEALGAFGDRRQETQPLEEAIRHLKSAFKIYTRKSFPHDWARVKKHIGGIYRMLGEGESDYGKLKQARRAYEAALSECDSSSDPLEWAAIKTNLATVFLRMGERDDGSLERAESGYRAALEIRTRECAPIPWATTQNNLAYTLLLLGEREGDSARLIESIERCRAALSVRTRDRLPLDWAQTTNNLGSALTQLGDLSNDSASIEEGAQAYRSALVEQKRRIVPLDWAMTQNNLGVALQRLGRRENGTSTLERAVEAFDFALEERVRSRVPYYWAHTQENLAETYLLLADRCPEPLTMLKKARSCARGALDVYRDGGATHDISTIERLLYDIDQRKFAHARPATSGE